MEKILNYINGKLVEPINGKYIENKNPATNLTYSLVPNSNKEDVELAVTSASNNSDNWNTSSIHKRVNLLNDIADLIERNLDELAKAESKDNGKPVILAKEVDIPRAAANFRFFASAIQHFVTETYATNSTIDYEIRQPIGIVGTISPWNLPLYLFTWKIAPALAAGNCVIAKPSEVTPMTAFSLSKICIDAGLPKGVLNIVHGLGPSVGAAISRHQDIKAISFTGSTATGREIAKVAAPMFKKLSLEMGGKNPVLIFEDASFDQMIKTTIRSSFSNQGEICFCGSRIYIQDTIYDKFKENFVKKVRLLKVGDPSLNETKIGAIVSEDHFKKIMHHIDLAKKEGGTIITGGNALTFDGEISKGFFIEPTVIEGLPQGCRTNKEEIFGPVVSIQPFSSEAEVIEYANDTQYGLSAVIWTENLSRAHRISHLINAGIIWVNCWMSRNLNVPFGGMKNSGLGREGGYHALKFFTEPKNITIKLAEDNQFSYNI